MKKKKDTKQIVIYQAKSGAKYADQGVTAIDDIDDLKAPPLDEFGTPVEIVDGIFGGREKYLIAVKELQQALYAG